MIAASRLSKPSRTALAAALFWCLSPGAIVCAADRADGAVYAGETLIGTELRAPDWPEDVRERLELDLEIAKAVFEVAPEREDSYIWLGRRYGYLGRYDEAVEVFTAGLQKFPDSYKLHRFRGRHRARSRDFDGAIEDYRAGIEKMDGISDSFEPDGMPNSRGLTISTYRSNLHYYLGQTYFATGDYAGMIAELDASLTSPIALPIEDHKVAVVFWKYLALKKLGKDRQAGAVLSSIPETLDLVENHSYHMAVKVLQGRVTAQAAREEGDSLSKFALGMKKQFEGDPEEAVRILRGVVAENAFGYWPAEVELTGALHSVE